MKITRAFIASLVVALAIPFASVFADEVTPITSLTDLTSTSGQAGNYRLDADITLSAVFTMRDGFVLDLNGHTLNAGSQYFKISGNATVKDLSSNQAGKIVGARAGTYFIYVYGDRVFNLESGTIQSEGYVLANAAATNEKAAGKINIKGGNVISTNNYTIINAGETNISGGLVKTNKSSAVAIQNSATGTLNISGGRVEASSIAILNNSKNMTVSGGTIYSATHDGVTGNTNSELVMTGGTIKTDSDEHSAVRLAAAGAKFTMNGGALIATASDPANPGYGGAGVMGFKDTEITINGGTITSYTFCVGGNGSVSGGNEGTNAKFTITGGTLTSNTTAIYAPQPNGVTKISGGTITGGDVALELRAGTLEITGGTFNGGSGNPYESTPNYSGTTAKNAAVVVAQHTTKLPINVKITGGTFNAEVPFVENNPQHNSAEDVAKIQIEISTDDYDHAPVFNATGDYTIFSEDVNEFVKAGRYTHDVPDEYVAPDHGEIVEADSMDAVYPYRKAEAEPAENGTVEISREQTLRGIEITINPQPAPGYEVTNIDVVDANGNHIPVVNNKYLAPESDTTVTVTFGTINPSTGDNILDYGAFMGICVVALGTAISSIRLARVIRRVL